MLTSKSIQTICFLTLPWILLSGCRSDRSKLHPKSDDSAIELIADINMFCGDCHVAPDPNTFARQHWPAEVRRGFDFYKESGRSDLTPPDFDATVAYYQNLAPERLNLPDPDEDLNTSRVRFSTSKLSLPPGQTRPGVSHLLSADGLLYYTDMISGQVGSISFDQREHTTSLLATYKHPAHIELVEFSADGSSEYVVSELGSFAPDDHAKGGVFLRRSEDGASVPLLDQSGRVSATSAADFDHDQDIDLVVAEFGWHKTGSIRMLRNESQGSEWKFESVTIEKIHGASHVEALDFDQDSDQDFIVLVSQEYESVFLYLNDGKAEFEQRLLFAAPIPDYGCSSIEVADIDGDQDPDILLTNGDSMDSLLLKPHHSVQWLENQGDFQFERHPISALPGVYGATAGDLDADGDLDVVACTMTWWDDLPFNSVVWFEQLPSGEFQRHSLDLSLDQHACLELGDYDQDGRLDIAVGEFSREEPKDTWITIWWNDGSVE